MEPPIISFITFNRAGLTARNLMALLETKNDFELYIVDNGSKDDTWKFVEQIQDSRIKCKKRFDKNMGGIYAVNFVLSHRKKDQFFINVDNDVCLHTSNWIEILMNYFEKFPTLGLLGATRPHWLEDFMAKYPREPQPRLISLGEMTYYSFEQVVGCLICIRPEVFNYLGYFCEETCAADKDMRTRINKFTPFHTGFTTAIHIDQQQSMQCENCPMKHLCTGLNCRECYTKGRYNNTEFSILQNKNYAKYMAEIKSGIRTPYCASIHDAESLKNYYYDEKMAKEMFDFYK